MLRDDMGLVQELTTEVKDKFRSDGKMQIEAKNDIKARVKRSIEKLDALANTFYPVEDIEINPPKKKNRTGYFN
jgi:hypothetical protein